MAKGKKSKKGKKAKKAKKAVDGEEEIREEIFQENCQEIREESQEVSQEICQEIRQEIRQEVGEEIRQEVGKKAGAEKEPGQEGQRQEAPPAKKKARSQACRAKPARGRRLQQTDGCAGAGSRASGSELGLSQSRGHRARRRHGRSARRRSSDDEDK